MKYRVYTFSTGKPMDIITYRIDEGMFFYWVVEPLTDTIGGYIPLSDIAHVQPIINEDINNTPEQE